jgi:hypothetical protein
MTNQKQISTSPKFGSSILAYQSNVRSGNVSSGIATLKHRFSAPFRWWPHSTARKVVQEICNLLPRIAASRQLPKWALFRLPQPPDGFPLNSFLQSCSEDIQSLRREHPWAGYLDAEIAAKAYAMGAAWASNNFDTGKSK